MAGVDEAGRGCLAGPVFASAVIFDPEAFPERRIRNCTDSKLLTPDERTIIAELIKKHALAWAVGIASVQEIDEINILQASFLAMRRALEQLAHVPDLVVVDGHLKIPSITIAQMAFVKGDLRCFPISAASILAKTHRDAFMVALDAEDGRYGFAIHKGYPTPDHRAAIQVHGPSRYHRLTFSGVREVLELLPPPQESQGL